jgi:hypothetical protein
VPQRLANFAFNVEMCGAPQEVKRDTNSPALIRPLADRRYSKIISQTWNPYAQHYK